MLRSFIFYLGISTPKNESLSRVDIFQILLDILHPVPERVIDIQWVLKKNAEEIYWLNNYEHGYTNLARTSNN